MIDEISYDISIVGGGHSGALPAIALCQAKFEGTIAIVGDEPELTDERPPLSKVYFAPSRRFERVLIDPAVWAIVSAVAPLREAGSEGENGIDVDEFCHTSLADLLAVANCAAHRNAFAEHARVHLRSFQNANDQAAVVAKLATGVPVLPWLWSNQRYLRLQTVGLPTGHNETVMRGDLGARSFSLISLREGRVIALDCVNATRDYVQGRALACSGNGHCADDIADAVALKDLQDAA